MWIIKNFKTEESQNKWIEKNNRKFQIEIIFVNNGFALHVKRRIKINIK